MGEDPLGVCVTYLPIKKLRVQMLSISLCMYVSAVAHLVVLGNLLLNGMRLLHYLLFLFPSLLLFHSKIGLLLSCSCLKELLSILQHLCVLIMSQVHSWFQNQQQNEPAASKNVPVLPKASPSNGTDENLEMPKGSKCLLLLFCFVHAVI